MSCPLCTDCYDNTFNDKTAAKELKEYRKKGPSKQTRWLIEQVTRLGVEGQSLLDIGGGVGAIQHKLLEAGAAHVVHVDASAAYLNAATEETKRLGYEAQVVRYHADFVGLAPNLDAVNIVTLDRVICCYPDMPALVGASAGLAEDVYALVYPRDTWWMRLAGNVLNGMLWLVRNPFRFYVHDTPDIEAVVQREGFSRQVARTMGLWHMVIYRREEAKQ